MFGKESWCDKVLANLEPDYVSWGGFPFPFDDQPETGGLKQLGSQPLVECKIGRLYVCFLNSWAILK